MWRKWERKEVVKKHLKEKTEWVSFDMKKIFSVNLVRRKKMEVVRREELEVGKWQETKARGAVLGNGGRISYKP